MPRSKSVAFVLLIVALSIAGTLAGEDREKAAKAEGVQGVQGRPVVTSEAGRSAHLLDRGDNRESNISKGGGPTGPIPIAFPGAGPTAMAAGFAAGVGAFGTATGAGAFVGNLFAPGADYPPSFLTGGTAPGFTVTGVYAWHSPFLKIGTMTALPAGSTRRILAAAAAAVPATPMASAAVGPGGFKIVTASGSPAAPAGGPTGIVGVAGNLVGSPVTVATGGFSAVYCGLAVGGPGFIDAGWAGNGVGAVIPPGTTPAPPTRNAFPPAFFGGAFPITAALFTATPQTQVAGCYAAGSTTPVELQSFHIN